MDVLEDFQWTRNRKGYRITPLKELHPHLMQTYPADALWIAPNGSLRNEIRYQPFARGADLCAAFANLRTSEHVQQFVNQHGLLTWREQHDPDVDGGYLPSDGTHGGEPISVALVEAEMFREVLHRAETPKALATYFENKIVPDFARSVQAGQIAIVPDLEEGLRIRLTLPTLLGAIWYQLVSKLSGRRLQVCKLRGCGGVFEVGPGAGKRADAEFCCIEHKVEFFNRRRRLARGK
jgi:hypothetical protein